MLTGSDYRTSSHGQTVAQGCRQWPSPLAADRIPKPPAPPMLALSWRQPHLGQPGSLDEVIQLAQGSVSGQALDVSEQVLLLGLKELPVPVLGSRPSMAHGNHLKPFLEVLFLIPLC